MKMLKAPHHCPFAMELHRLLVDAPHKGTVMRKAFPSHIANIDLRGISMTDVWFHLFSDGPMPYKRANGEYYELYRWLNAKLHSLTRWRYCCLARSHRNIIRIFFNVQEECHHFHSTKTTPVNTIRNDNVELCEKDLILTILWYTLVSKNIYL